MTKLINKAIEFAAEAHSGQMRKGTDIPYITHPLAAMEILKQLGCSGEVQAAGVLHDTLEDTSATAEQLTELFGERITGLVQGVSENKALSWEERKAHTVEELKTASPELCAVVFADKLANIRSMVSDYQVLGDGLWSRFNRGRDKQLQVYGMYRDFFGTGAALKSFTGFYELYEDFVRCYDILSGGD